MRCLAAGRPFRTRGWQAAPFGPAAVRALPLEPLVKLTLPFVGILGELWLGHESWRTLYQANGHFFTDHLNDWCGCGELPEAAASPAGAAARRAPPGGGSS